LKKLEHGAGREGAKRGCRWCVCDSLMATSIKMSVKEYLEGGRMWEDAQHCPTCGGEFMVDVWPETRDDFEAMDALRHIQAAQGGDENAKAKMMGTMEKGGASSSPASIASMTE